MKREELNLIISNKEALNKRIDGYIKGKTLAKIPPGEAEIAGHIQKAEHNLEFVKDNLKLRYLDWAITGSYYAVYQAVLALINFKGYSSKSHDASLCVLIKEYLGEILDAQEILMLNHIFLEYNDIQIYVQSKEKRENASYSTNYLFEQKEVEKIRQDAIRFVNRAKDIINAEGFE